MYEFENILDNHNNMLSLSKAAEILGVSDDTVRNWVKLGRIKADSTDPILFSAEYIRSFNSELESSEKLKSRRNKSRQSANHIAKSYISSKSANYRSLYELFEALSETDADILSVIKYYAAELLSQRELPQEIIKRLLNQNPHHFTEKPFPENTDSGLPDENSQNHPSFDEELFKAHPLTYVHGEDTLGMLYISFRKLRDKKASGSYYTPFFVVDRMILDLAKRTDLSKSGILDPACGTGNFLLRLPDDVAIDNIHGFDIDPVAVLIARINIAMKYQVRSQLELSTVFKNIAVHDFIMNGDGFGNDAYVQAELFQKKADAELLHKQDVYIGNPPWGYSYSRKEACTLKDKYLCCRSNNKPESFDLFIEKSLRESESGGLISFLLPQALLEAELHTDTRRIILEHAEILSLHYIGDVFDKVQCPCIILTLKSRVSRNTQIINNSSLSSCTDSQVTASGPEQPAGVDVYFEKQSYEQLKEVSSFRSHDPGINVSSIHILCNDYENKLIRKIRSTDNFTLKDHAEFALGIVTGDNRNLIKDSLQEGYEPIIKGKEIDKYRINKPSGYIEYRPENFQQCAKTSLYRAESKLLYRFISDRPVVAHDKNKILTLNSANILIPDVPGYSHEYIMALLNSSVLAFYYLKSFKSLKVLRSSLESLPLAVCSDGDMKRITDSVHILESENSAEHSEKRENISSSEYDMLINDLDKRIADLYTLTKAEFSYIKSII